MNSENKMKMNISENLKQLKNELPENVSLVAVTKTKPIEDIMEAYNAGHRVFGENKVQEMESKWQELPKDIEWHMIGHLQRNKVKYMAPFVSLIHAVDSLRLLREINKEARKNDRVINCLLQIKIAEEDSKFGMDKTEALQLLDSNDFKKFENIKIIGLMGMATFTDDEKQVSNEFKSLKTLFDSIKEKHNMPVLSMGMSGDYKLAIKNGSNMVQIGRASCRERG